MGRSPRKHERSHAEVVVWKPREFKRRVTPLDALAAAAALAEGGCQPKCDGEGSVVGNRSVSGVSAEPSLLAAQARGPANPGSDLEPDEAPGFAHPDPMGILHQDGDDEGKSPPRVVVPKSGGFRVRTEADGTKDLSLEDSEDKEGIPVDREGPSEPCHSIPFYRKEEAAQLVKTLVNGQSLLEPGVLEKCSSKVVSLLTEATCITAALRDEVPQQILRSHGALRTRVSELEQQVQELTGKLYSTEEELEVTKATLRGTQAAMLEAQSDRVTAIAAMNSLAMRAGALFARLGTVLDPPPNLVDSLEETVKQLTSLVSLIGPVSDSHAANLARSSLTFGVAALLCRERGVEGLCDPLAGDTRRFIRSQGPEFQLLMGQVVDTIQQEVAKALQGGGSRGSGCTNEGTAPELH